MWDLGLSIIFSSVIFVVFKMYSRTGIDTSYAIVVNYLVASLVGFSLSPKSVILTEIPGKPWFWGTLILGVLFILVFNLMAATSQRSGISVASVATKMSLVIPVIIGVVAYNEKLGPLKVVGIALALAAVYFSSAKAKSTPSKKSTYLLPVLVFLGSGLIDSSIKFLEETRIPKDEFPLFSATVFAFAATTGLLFVAIKPSQGKNKKKFTTKNILGGIALGVPNYFSIYFLLAALQHETLNSASIFTINNVAIVMITTLLGIMLFKEEVSIKNWTGIGLAVISILLVAYF
ncbi:MAG: DMT family transporter [Arenibacter sp.]|nr:DMT family transporter [Arenibacter sp.]